jgi:hypothetical protein
MRETPVTIYPIGGLVKGAWREIDERSPGLLCRCGYDADDRPDLQRHITSWERWNLDAIGRNLDHVED